MSGSKSNYVAGVDFGSTFSCVGIMRDNRVEIIANDVRNRTTPSCVAFTESEVLVGESARDQAATNPGNTVFGIRRLLGREFESDEVQCETKRCPVTIIKDGNSNTPVIQIQLKDQTKVFKPEEIAAMILKKMHSVAENYLGEPIKSAVITVPAYFDTAQRQATRDACAIAGLDILDIIDEPVAAALTFGLDKRSEPEQHVLVFDLGGDTLDVTLLFISKAVIVVKATAANHHLGGSDFNRLLAKFVIEKFKKRFMNGFTTSSGALHCLYSACERAKIALSTTDKATIDIDFVFDGEIFSTDITRTRFEGLCAGKFQKCLALIERVLADASLSKSQVDEVVLVGGSSRIPKVQQLIKEFFNGKEPLHAINPEEVVAYGAAVYAAALSDDR